jgi:small subunit ribosomal protein S25e
MPAKPAKPSKTKPESGGSSGGKAKKKKWSKGKVRDKLNNMVSLTFSSALIVQ